MAEVLHLSGKEVKDTPIQAHKYPVIPTALSEKRQKVLTSTRKGR